MDCLRCGKNWTPRTEGKLPVECPQCKSSYWNVARTRPPAPSAAEFIVRQAEFWALVKDNKYSHAQIAQIIGRSTTTVAKYMSFAAIPTECLDRLRADALIKSEIPETVHKCKLCGRDWVGKRSATPPAECRHCRSKYWNDGITPQDARTRLTLMSHAVAGTIHDFCAAVGYPYEKISPYFSGGKTMSVEQLDHLAEILRGKGYKFRQ